MAVTELDRLALSQGAGCWASIWAKRPSGWPFPTGF